MYEIEITDTAIELIQEIKNRRKRRQIRQRIEKLENDPVLQGKPLQDHLQGLLSVRACGQRYRIIYEVDERTRTVYIHAAGIRKEGDKKDIYAVFTRIFNRRR